ncbi:protein zyg-11 homolog [Dendronephthya gigantea]|uniref:protein zyg-11 homolog n=1 Tax=Dendronephthya gigantea TaxID=151771 RepID=UPI0010698AED|nr:protein zyg-11 homolog [Dendronephthya gigantea]
MCTTSPGSLLYLTVDFIAKNYKQLCDVRKYVENGEEHSYKMDHYYIPVLVFKRDCCLPSVVCELLLQRFLFHYNSSSSIDFFTLFTNPDRCPLKKFSLANVYHKFFYDHDSSLFNILKMIISSQNLQELDTGPLYNHIILDTDFSKSNCVTTLKKVTISGHTSGHTRVSFLSAQEKPIRDSFLGNFTNLKHLSLRDCEVNIKDNDVEILASELKHLESLDLSSTLVSTIHALNKLAKSLKVLIIHNTPLVQSNMTDLFNFSNLRHLDISRKINEDNDNMSDSELNKFFTSKHCLTLLTSLDISGAGILDNDAFQHFFEKHKRLCFLGLLGVHHRLNSCNALRMENVQVTGERSVDQVLACLSHYRNRPSYLTKALKRLFNLSYEDNLKENVDKRRNIIKLVLDIMRKYMNINFEDLQTAASACLHNYVKCDAENGTNSLHVSYLSDMVAVVIEVLETFPKAEQIQRNCLVVMYNRYILSGAKFNAFQLFDLLFKAVISIPEGNVVGIALDMCAYLSSKISVEETLKLGTRQNIEKLLSILRTHVQAASAEPLVDNILLCSLRVLWNLTDEAPRTCHLVIQNAQQLMVFQALQTFDKKSDVLTKLLGVMNNLAEVVAIRPALMCDECVSLLRKYLDENYTMDVSYFAAGTLCNLLLDLPEHLVLNCGTKSDLLLCLGSAVNRWKHVETVMVGYRTFKSFVPLLNSSFPDVQLWAIWAIHHVCSQKVERYSQLCFEEGIVDLLRTRTTSGNRPDVKELAVQALNVIESNGDKA